MGSQAREVAVGERLESLEVMLAKAEKHLADTYSIIQLL